MYVDSSWLQLFFYWPTLSDSLTRKLLALVEFKAKSTVHEQRRPQRAALWPIGTVPVEAFLAAAPLVTR